MYYSVFMIIKGKCIARATYNITILPCVLFQLSECTFAFFVLFFIHFYNVQIHSYQLDAEITTIITIKVNKYWFGLNVHVASIRWMLFLCIFFHSIIATTLIKANEVNWRRKKMFESNRKRGTLNWHNN